MKTKIFTLATVLALTGCATAPGAEWVAPAVIGGVIGYTISQSQQPSVIVQAPPVVINAPILVPRHRHAHPSHSGTVWREEWRYDSRCSCKRLYLVQIR